MTKDLTIAKNNVSIFLTIQAFEEGQRIAKALSSADLVPAAYKGNIPNTMIPFDSFFEKSVPLCANVLDVGEILVGVWKIKELKEVK